MVSEKEEMLDRRKGPRTKHMGRGEKQAVKPLGFELPGHVQKNMQRYTRDSHAQHASEQRLDALRKELGIPPK